MDKLEILWIMLLEYKINWGIKKHSHDYYQLFYILIGTGKEIIQVGDEKISLKKGKGLIVKPNETHVLLPIKNESIRIIDIKFHLEDPKLIGLIESISPSFEIKNESFIEKLLEIRKEWKSKKAYNQEIVCVLMEELIYLLAREAMSDEVQSVDLSLCDLNRIFLNLKDSAEEKMIDYIDRNYNKGFTLEKMAEELSYNKSYLCRKFKEDTSWTISNYLNYRKIFAAIELLRYTQKSIEEITSLIGFSSAQYFSNTFKKIVGISPLALRESEMSEIVTDTLNYGKFTYRYKK